MKVIIFSYDKFSFIDPFFFHFYEKNWPDNPYETKLLTYQHRKKQWSDMAIKYLESIEDDKFLLILNDYIIKSKVDTEAIKNAESLCKNDIGCVSIGPLGKSKIYLFDTGVKGYKDFPTDKVYCVSLQAAIWKRKLFIDVLEKNESVWQIEVDGSKRFQKFNKRVIRSNTPIIDYHRGGYMIKGRVVKEVEQWTKNNW